VRRFGSLGVRRRRRRRRRKRKKRRRRRLIRRRQALNPYLTALWRLKIYKAFRATPPSLRSLLRLYNENHL
jgi:hypothetical protein